MPKASPHSPIQPVLPFDGDVVRFSPLESIDWERRMTLRNLVWLHAADQQLPDGFATEQALADAHPLTIESGLYISVDDPRHDGAEGLVKVNTKFATANAKEAIDEIRAGKRPKVPPTGVSIVFPPDEFESVGHYPRALAKHMRSRTRKANFANPNRDEADETVGRSGGHILENYIGKMEVVENRIVDERKMLRSLFRDLASPVWQAHYKARNLEKRRETTDEKIHETSEIATINLNLGTDSIKALHNAIKYNLYGHNTHDEQVAWWKSYIALVMRYGAARIDRLTSATDACRDELKQFQPFLDRKSR